MTTHYPIVFETEENGDVSAYAPGLPIYAQAPTEAEAERAMQDMMRSYFLEHPQIEPARVKVAAVDVRHGGGGRSASSRVTILSAAALVGARTSRRKAAASRANGRLGGRPRLRRD